MSHITRIGIDTSKAVFTLHCVDDTGRAVLRTNLRRAQMVAFFKKLPATEIAMEACGSSHHWGRELSALGHDRSSDPAAVCQALRETRQERSQRRRGDLRGRRAPGDALRAGEVRRAASPGDGV